MKHLLRSLALVGLLAAVAGAETKAPSPKEVPPALRIYKGRVIAQTMHWMGAEWLLRKEREREESTQLMMRNLGLKEGQSACDLGSGNGYHTLMMADIVGKEGKVVAVDIQKEMLDMLNDRAKEKGIGNVKTILGELHDPKLPANAFDLVLIVDAYHEFSHPVHMLEGIRQSLKPTGRLALVEFRTEDPKVPIKKLHKMSKKQIMKEIPPNGFKLVGEFDELPWQHLMFFERAPLPEESAEGE
ncbi:MAG: class I SAM-dependent methyltransferase [Verrucomicrobiota bacterium]